MSGGGQESAPGRVWIDILGIGEITTTIEVKGGHWGKVHPTDKRWMKLAYKRMPAFDTRGDMERYVHIHEEYQRLLGQAGIAVPWHDNLVRQRADGKWVVYNRQERLPTEQVACLMIQKGGDALALAVFRFLLGKLEAVFEHNAARPELALGFDAQVPNWVFTGFDPREPRIRPDEPVVYIDTSTPLYRIDGAEQLDTELFLRAIPALFRPVVRHFFLAEVVDRYYRPRDVILDLVASYITHKRPELVPELVDIANAFMADSPHIAGARGFTAKEIASYNREDVIIWHFFRTLKRADRFVTERLLGGQYEQRLPKGPPGSWKNLVGAGGMGLVDGEPDDRK